ncbi:MAG: hypothetical protein O3A96_12180 [Proteobacteria bacterium]|nr:hypothetical protein [Pseudomonadota bacterium]
MARALVLVLALFAAGPAAAGEDQAAGGGKSAAERLDALCMLDASSNAAYCACGARVSAEHLAPRDLDIMAFAMERTVWGGSEDIVGDARAAFGLTEEEVILAWRNIAAAGLKTSEACRHLR